METTPITASVEPKQKSHGLEEQGLGSQQDNKSSEFMGLLAQLLGQTGSQVMMNSVNLISETLQDVALQTAPLQQEEQELELEFDTAEQEVFDSEDFGEPDLSDSHDTQTVETSQQEIDSRAAAVEAPKASADNSQEKQSEHQADSGAGKAETGQSMAKQNDQQANLEGQDTAVRAQELASQIKQELDLNLNEVKQEAPSRVQFDSGVAQDMDGLEVAELDLKAQIVSKAQEVKSSISTKSSPQVAQTEVQEAISNEMPTDLENNESSLLKLLLVNTAPDAEEAGKEAKSASVGKGKVQPHALSLAEDMRNMLLKQGSSFVKGAPAFDVGKAGIGNKVSATEGNSEKVKSSTPMRYTTQQQIIEKISKILKSSSQSSISSTVVVRLDPPKFGAVTVRLQQRSDQLFARLMPEKPEVESLLRERVQELVHVLSSAGFKTDNITVSIGKEVVDTEFFGFENAFLEQQAGEGENKGETELPSKDAEEGRESQSSSAIIGKSQNTSEPGAWIA